MSRTRALLSAGVILAGALLGAAPLAAQHDARLEGRLDAATRSSVAALVDSARASGLPVEPLVQKALQGAARGAPGPLISGAVARLLADLSVARRALGSTSTAAELEAGASAVRAGAKPADLARIRAARPDRPLTVALGTLADLVSQGVPVDTATSVIRALLARDAGDDDLAELRRGLARDVAGGTPPGVAAIRRLQGVRGVSGAPTLTPRPPVGPPAGTGRPVTPQVLPAPMP